MGAKQGSHHREPARNDPAEQMEAARPGNSRTYQGFVLFVRGSLPRGEETEGPN